MTNKDYRLTVSLSFKEVDELGARMRAIDFVDSLPMELYKAADFKLQRMFEDKQPEGVRFGYKRS